LLYLLVIIVASILFSRRIAFSNCGNPVFFLLLAGMTALALCGEDSAPPSPACRRWRAFAPGLVMNSSGFLAVAYLASLLAQSLRKKGVELEEKPRGTSQPSGLQPKTIIHSMRGGFDHHGPGWSHSFAESVTGEEILDIALLICAARSCRN